MFSAWKKCQKWCSAFLICFCGNWLTTVFLLWGGLCLRQMCKVNDDFLIFFLTFKITFVCAVIVGWWLCGPTWAMPSSHTMCRWDGWNSSFLCSLTPSLVFPMCCLVRVLALKYMLWTYFRNYSVKFMKQLWLYCIVTCRSFKLLCAWKLPSLLFWKQVQCFVNSVWVLFALLVLFQSFSAYWRD